MNEVRWQQEHLLASRNARRRAEVTAECFGGGHLDAPAVYALLRLIVQISESLRRDLHLCQNRAWWSTTASHRGHDHAYTTTKKTGGES